MTDSGNTSGWQQRTELLLGGEAVRKLNQASVLVVGLGGVGAYAAEMIVRAGVGNLTVVDGDRLYPTNLNRQLPALLPDMGRLKAEVMAERLLDINPELHLEAIPEYVKDGRMIEILESKPYDYVVDAIDTLSPKIYLLYHCVNRRLPVVSAMGSGGKLDPMQFKICDISQTYNCPLADVLRKRLHKLGVYTGIQAVFSPENVPEHAVREVEGEANKKSMVGTVSYMPSIAGCLCASVVIRELCGQKVESDLPVPPSVRKKIKAQEQVSDGKV
ncbi:MAG: tRNA threonylcarbamoyladenosine dehydratase [Bacteroides sp.]|nr:tRNA threonylcarbamoyladenosine dehydratase [Bacteroides sp.]